ncbi:MAG: CehA/McbA family metallohydrolase [Methanosarcina sp.]
MRNSVLYLLMSVAFAGIVSCSTNSGKTAENWKWYRGNTHTHATFSDENDTNDVPEIASWYEDEGYNFLVLSEHNDHLKEKKIFSHDELSHPPSFLMISGLELSNSRHHLAFGINYYIGDETSLQDGVEKTLAAGGIPILNHPQSPVEKTADILAVKGLKHMEIANGGRPQHIAASEVLWDSLLSDPNGRLIYAVGADDNHYSRKNVGRAWIMVKAPELTKEAIMDNFSKGNYYVSNGVLLNDYQADNKSITVSSMNGDTIRFIGKYGAVLKTVAGKDGKYSISGDELYVRAKITGAGKAAWTQPVFISSGK